MDKGGGYRLLEFLIRKMLTFILFGEGSSNVLAFDLDFDLNKKGTN